MSHSIVFSESGSPDVLRLAPAQVGQPAAGEVRLRHTAIGVNFIDIYQRSGLYPLPLPSGLGSEAAGVVEAVGEGVDWLRSGDRVAYAGGPLGAYSSQRLISAQHLVKLPDEIGDETAACAMLQGMTVEYLVQRTYPVQPGQTVLWHAAAGGVGQIALQWLTAMGAKVIATVGSAAKAEIARALGAAHVINYGEEDVVARVRDITGGKGVPVVYDSVGKDTFQISLSCLAPRGMMVSFGNASGPVPALSPLELTKHGSLFLTRPKLGDYTASREELEASTQALFARLADGRIRVTPSHRYPLAEAAQAHRDLEARRTTGSVILLP
ncbi:quinone oxidoreductase family protein [Chromobacterium sphagni]|uniref:Quinone oxidoreductase n=1 Tax=Chromobacterium sphagni TaxID=1903179 RepID=A0A1S1WYJ4_9NEIS|nr:quinone oxidoreductase [Chromobacterium sphagni]OHX12190.1 quinone oxidoreductase [Chromobacterium sphagni]OHX21725.1 quinone oxidoreductase [Chromobacterium sphagni]